ncbi:bZIP transcription factor [Acinetobacter baumannii]|nr:bZIP transcription factor [Acinetobacter baumannii]
MYLKKFFVVLLLVSLVGCGKPSITQEDYDNMVSEKDQQIADLEEQVTKLHEHISNLEAKTEEVNNQFKRFENENWRDVVPDADNAVEELNTEVENNPDASY